MIKTQVQIPDHLHREAKRIAAEYEMSFAEVVRRGLERMIPAYPPRRKGEWQPPEPVHLGLRCPIDDDEWRLLANDPDYVPRHLPRPSPEAIGHFPLSDAELEIATAEGDAPPPRHRPLQP